jgi:hypothetical protein
VAAAPLAVAAQLRGRRAAIALVVGLSLVACSEPTPDVVDGSGGGGANTTTNPPVTLEGAVASNIAFHVNRDVDPAPTPIHQLYTATIETAGEGDRIAALQKYFRNEPITRAVLDAARRGAQVETVYRADVDPSCEALQQAGDTFDCAAMFRKSFLAHHKNLMVLRGDSDVLALVGSFNLRVRSTSKPRVHSAVSLEVAGGLSLFEWYLAVADEMLTGTEPASDAVQLPIDGGGTLTFSVPSSSRKPVRDMLAPLSGCDGTLWMSYFGAADDSVGGPVFDELERLLQTGCDVRVLLDEEQSPIGKLALESRGVPVRFPTFPAGSALLGHKLVFAEHDGEMFLMQSSANLTAADVLISNLTATVQAPQSATIRDTVDAELERYW